MSILFCHYGTTCIGVAALVQISGKVFIRNSLLDGLLDLVVGIEESTTICFCPDQLANAENAKWHDVFKAFNQSKRLELHIPV